MLINRHGTSRRAGTTGPVADAVGALEEGKVIGGNVGDGAFVLVGASGPGLGGLKPALVRTNSPAAPRLTQLDTSTAFLGRWQLRTAMIDASAASTIIAKRPVLEFVSRWMNRKSDFIS